MQTSSVRSTPGDSARSTADWGRDPLRGTDLQRKSDSQLADLRRDTLGFIFQQFNLIPTLTARDDVEWRWLPPGSGSSAARARGRLLSRVRLDHRLDNLPSQLAGGGQQRVAIARALANQPRALLADEPTDNLDSSTGEDDMAILETLGREEGLSVVLITHDPTIAAAASRLVRIRDGRVLAPDDEAETMTPGAP